MGLSGKYTFYEDFGHGYDEGSANLVVTGDQIAGTLSFTEYIEGEEPFNIICTLAGFVKDKDVFIKVIDFKFLDDVSFDYHPDDREGVINDKGQIVGSSIDAQGVCGVFTLTPLLK